MQEYLFSLFAVSLLIALVGILTPSHATGSLKWLSSLLFICVLAAPLSRYPNTLMELFLQMEGEWERELPEEEYREEAEQALDAASKTYLAQILTQRLEQEFSIPTGEVRCVILWEGEDADRPKKVTVILSGSAIWKNPDAIEKAVTQLLGCECITAIE